MANTIDWGEASVNNTNGYGKGATNNTIRWGKIYESSASGETNITGASGFSNTLSTRFDGVDDYVSMGNVLNFERTEAFSFSFWVARAAINAHTLCISKMNPSGNRRGYFININTSNIVTIFLRNNTSNTSQSIIAQSTTTIADTNWHHIVFTYDGSSTTGGMKIYIDGTSDTLTTSGTLSATIASSATTPFLLGALSTAPSLPMNAALDEVAVFNTELSATDVENIYNGGGTGLPGDLTGTSGLVSWYRMGDGDTFPTITDNAGSNNGTMTNMSSGNFISNVPT